LIPRRAAKRDASERELVETLRALGGFWIRGGPMDGWAGIGGHWVCVECKTPRRAGGRDRLQPTQVALIETANAHRLPVAVWRTADDVIATVNRIRVGER
jgi:Holliday junction resolvase